MYFDKATSGDNFWVYWLMTILAVPLAYVIGQFPLIGLQLFQVNKHPSIGSEEVNEFFNTMDFSLIKVHSNVGLLFMLLMFVIAFLVFMLCIRHLHKLPFKFLITANKRIDWNKIYFAFGLWFVISLFMEGASALMNPEAYYFNFKPMSFIFLLLICIIILPIQTSLEELYIRGYIMPGISLLVNNKWLPLLISSILFGLIHGMNPEVEKFGFWTMQLYYVSAGLFLGLITILDDSLELALGVHAATNVFGAAFFSFDGSVLQTDSLVKASEVNPTLMTIAFIIGAIIFCVICSRKYKWKSPLTIFDDYYNSNTNRKAPYKTLDL